MIPRQIPRQRDFSAGELDEGIMRRDDTPLMRSGARQMSNKRITSSGAVDQRPGRRALFIGDNRTEDVKIEGSVYRISFGVGTLHIREQALNSLVLTQSGYPWVAADIADIVWAQFDNNVIICFPDMQPVVATLAADGTWSTADFAFATTLGGQKRTPFYRLSAPAITLQPSNVTGTVDIEFSDDVLTADHVGTRLRYQGRQLTIASVVDGQNGTATVNERLFPSQRLRLSTDPLEQFQIGDVVEGETTGATGEVVATSVSDSTVVAAVIGTGGSGYAVGDIVQVVGGTGDEIARLEVAAETGGIVDTFTVSVAGHYTVAPSNPVSLTTITGSGTGATATLTLSTTTATLHVVLFSQIHFSGETLIGPNGQGTISTAINIIPLATKNWDDEVINDLRGWPASVSVDQRRLIFADIPAIPGGIGWSAIDDPTNHYSASTEPADAIFEIVPSKARVYHVQPGDDEFVVTDGGLFYVPISETNPLRPGSVAFRSITAENPARIRPVITPNGMIYVSAGLNQLVAVTATGQTAKPYVAREVASFHTHLLSTPLALASSTGTDQFPERYIYVLNSDGTVVVGRYDSGRDWVGLVPWTSGGGGLFKWVAARESTVLFSTRYTVNDVAQLIVERLDADVWLDANVLVNNAPVALAPGVGQGPLWFLAGRTVSLMEGRRYLGEHLVNSAGNVQVLAGEDWSSETLMAGFSWEEVLEPFIPHAGEGRSARQTMRRRHIACGTVTVQNSTGFVVAGRRVPPYRAGEDEGEEPTLREQTVRFKKLGRSFDPRIEVVKDVPGPLRIIEFAVDAGI